MSVYKPREEYCPDRDGPRPDSYATMSDVQGLMGEVSRRIGEISDSPIAQENRAAFGAPSPFFSDSD